MSFEPLVHATINLSALRGNYHFLQAKAPEAKAFAVIKADAYGHGLIAVAAALQQADGFAVARLEEAIQLRDNGFSQKILLLEGVLSFEAFEWALHHKVDMVFPHHSQLSFLEQYSKLKGNKKSLSIFLKINTGMNRLGFSIKEFSGVVERLQAYDWLNIDTLMTHFASSEARDNEVAKVALQQFLDVVKKYFPDGVSISTANSAAILSLPKSHGDWLRVGNAMYGVSPFETEQKYFRTVMTLRSRVISVYDIEVGQAVGYGAKWIAEQATTIAVLGIGYGDGYPRHAKNGTPVLIDGIEYPLIGSVSMDMMTVDVSRHQCADTSVNVGDEVILWGEDAQGNQLLANKVAQFADTIAYQLFCNVTQRVQKEYIDG